MNVTFGGNTAGAAATVSTGTLGLHGGNNVTLSQNGNNITFSGASIPAQTAYNFSNSNGVSFGTNGSTVTATVATTYAGSNHSHGNPTLNLTNLSGTTASASNGLTLSLSAAAQGLTSQSNQALSGSNGSYTFQTATFGSSNGMHFYTTNGSMVGSYTVPTQTNQTVGFYATGANTTGQSSSNTFDARSMSISAQGGLYAGMSGNTIHLSAATTYAASNHSHGNPTLNLTNISGTTASNSGGLTLSLSAAAPGAGGGAALSAGTQSVNTGTVNFANSNGVSFGMSGSNQITASVETTYAASNHSHGNPTLALTNLSGTTASNSGGLTLSLSAAAPGGGGGIALANSQTAYTSGTANLNVAGGAMTIASTTGQSFNFSVPATSSLSATGALSISTNGSTISLGAPAFSAGMSSVTYGGGTGGTSGTASNQFVIAAGSNITLSQSTGAGGNTLAIHGAAGGGGGGITYSYFNPQDAFLQVTGNHGQATLHMQPSKVPNVAFDRIAMPIYYSNASNSTASVSASFWFGVYTRTSDSFSLASSTSMSTNWTGSGTVNSANLNGIRLLTIGTTGTIVEDQYYFGIISRTTTGGANATLQQLVASQQNSSFSGIMGAASNASIQYTRGLGYYSVSTTGMPGSIAISQLRGNSSQALRQPLFYFVNSTF
jgi:hypothetical protein